MLNKRAWRQRRRAQKASDKRLECMLQLRVQEGRQLVLQQLELVALQHLSQVREEQHRAER
jgi:hypothetical protein